MMFSKILLAVTFAIEVAAFEDSDMGALRGLQKKKNRAKKQHLRIVSQETDLTFLPANKLSESINGNEPVLIPSIPGSTFVQNGAVHLKADVKMNGSQLENAPNAEDGYFYNQQCTAMAGGAEPLKVSENLCHYNICMGDFGCLFMRSGGSFSFSPGEQSADAVPDVEAIILGGTKSFAKEKGTVIIKTISVTVDNVGKESVLELEKVPYLSASSVEL